MDYILRATAGCGAIRAFFATTCETVERARVIHDTSPTATAALGRLLTAGAMMGSMLKADQDLLTLTIKGDGPVQGLLVTADSAAHVKGYAYNPSADVPPKGPGKLDVSGLLGAGSLTVIKDMGLKEPYVGQVALVSGEIAEDITYYFAKSEQTPSAVALGVLVDTDCTVRQAGGFMIQLLPGATDEDAALLEAGLANLPGVTTLLERGMTPETMLDMILEPFGYEITDRIPVSYTCNCSRERVEKALISIGQKDLSNILEEDGQLTMNCHFCGEDYHFDKNALAQILEAISAAKPKG